ncbi:MAG: phosphatidate cytidylyltransferase [Roseimicrobium sp.]
MPESPTLAAPGALPIPQKSRVFLVRLASTLALWAFIAVALWMKLDWLVMLIIALFSLGTGMEYFRMEKADAKAAPYRWMGFALCVGYWIAVCWHTMSRSGEPPWWMEAVALVTAVQFAFLPPLRHGLEGPATIVRIYLTIFGVVYTAILFGFVARLLYFEGAPSGRHLMLMAIMVAKFSDMGAYAFGTWFGRHKLVPHISPGKTWEGLAGAFTGAYVAMVSMMLIVPDKLLPLTWTHALILAPLLCIASVIGDLAESILKRCHGIKDSGHKLPGIGGILDLTDSILFAAPVCYFYLKAIS